LVTRKGVKRLHQREHSKERKKKEEDERDLKELIYRFTMPN